MIDFADLGRRTLKDEQDLGALDAVLSEVANFSETRTAAEVGALLLKKIAADSTLAVGLRPAVAKFQALALPVLTDQQAVDLFASIGLILSDERIGLYERLRARMLVLPASRRTAFAQTVLNALKSSRETIGSGQTVGQWAEKYLAAKMPAEQFFQQPEFRQLDDVTDHAVRHLIHIVTLLQTPDQAVSAPAIKRSQPKPAPSPAPLNLPVEPAAVPTPLPKTVPPIPATPPSPSTAAVAERLRSFGMASVSAGPVVAHLTPDDEEEIQGHSEKLHSMEAGPNVHQTIGETIEKIAKDQGLQFSEENLQRRFETIMTSRLKDIRSTNETLELLTRPVKVGGLALDPAVAQRVVEAAAAGAGKFSDTEGVRRLAEQVKQKEAQPMPRPPKIPPAPQLEPMPRPSVAPMPPVAPPPSPAPMWATRRPQIAQAPQPFRVPVAPAAMRPAADGRPTMSDIRGSSRLTGPIEELRQMNISDYRRLGPDPVAVIRRVYEKIQRLGKESFTRRAEGIRAWRESDVYKLYLSMGHESLASGKSIRDVSYNHQTQGQPALTEQEFTLIADLNRKLRA